MTYPARIVGRPIRQDEAGRDLILRRTRAAMRVWPQMDLSRRALAQHAGVTPALISYYFTNRASLFEAAARPVIEGYGDEVRRVLNEKGSSSDRFRDIIKLYLNVHYREGALLETYTEFADLGGAEGGLKLLSQIQAEAVAFVGTLLDERCILGECAETVQAIMWGMCKQVARKAGIASTSHPGVDARVAAETDLLYEFFMNGVAIVLPADPMLQAS